MSANGRTYLWTSLLSVVVLLSGCEIANMLEPARDLSGRWVGSGPNGATYQDNVANPNCAYESDLVLDLTQNGGDLGGTLQLTVRSWTKLINTSVPCLPVGTGMNQRLFGDVGTTRVNFTLEDGVTVFSGTYTTNIFSGDFVVNGPSGVIGTFRVIR